MNQVASFERDTQGQLEEHESSQASEKREDKLQLVNTASNMETLNSSKLTASKYRSSESSLLTRNNVSSSQVADYGKEQGPNKTKTSVFKLGTEADVSKHCSSENLRKEAENINMRIRFLQSQLAAKEAALESRKGFLERREQLAAKSACISLETKKSCKYELPEPLHVTVNRIQTENARRVSESHQILDYSLHVESFTDIYKKLQEGSLEIQASQEEDFQSRVMSYIQRERESQLERIRRLREEYFTLRDAWTERIRKMDRQRSKEGNSNSRERDVWLVRAIRGTDTVKVSRNRGPSSSPANGSSSEEGDTRLENDNGKQVNGYSERFQNSTTAVIPGQVSLFQPFEGGNVLYENAVVQAHFDSLVNPWTRAERIIFLKKFLQYGKNFRKIATFLEYKTTEDVVRYYFKNKLKLNLKLLAREYLGARQQSWKASSAILASSGFPADSVTRRWILDNFKGLKNPSEQTLEDDIFSSNKSTNWKNPQTLANIIGTSFETQVKKVLRQFGLRSIIDHAPTFRSSLVCSPIGRDGLIPPYYLIEKIKMRQQKENLIERRCNGIWKVEAKKRKMDVKKYRWTTKERNTFFKLFKELGCDFEKISEQIPTKSPLQLRAFYDEYISQKATEASEGDSTNPNSSSVGSDGEVAAFTRNLRRRRESQENSTRKRFRKVDVDAVCKEDPNEAENVLYNTNSVSQNWKTERFLNEDSRKEESLYDGDITKDCVTNNQSNTEQDDASCVTNSVGRRTLNVLDLLSE